MTLIRESRFCPWQSSEDRVKFIFCSRQRLHKFFFRDRESSAQILIRESRCCAVTTKKKLLHNPHVHTYACIIKFSSSLVHTKSRPCLRKTVTKAQVLFALDIFTRISFPFVKEICFHTILIPFLFVTNAQVLFAFHMFTCVAFPFVKEIYFHTILISFLFVREGTPPPKCRDKSASSLHVPCIHNSHLWKRVISV